ncbi:hypothetical protein [Mycobacterium interjectum]|uniref:hypothetical protein n=1 Tax=Mycobacterium interjectum TaxID=33895 RepID=UPI000A96ADC7|nr:hypothetical protein [Mycobacterium interjectum]MCV7091144.1 hypothetical protein [Mycobacterium interjectum]
MNTTDKTAQNALPQFLTKTLEQISGTGAAEVTTFLTQNTGTARGFTENSEKALLNGSQQYFAQVGKRAIERANKQRSEVVELSDIEGAITSLNSGPKIAAFYSGAGVLGAIGSAALVTALLVPPDVHTPVWILWVSGVLCVIALVLTIFGIILNVRD